jgi:hypothetical protein
LEALGDSEIFEGEFVLVQRRDLRAEFEHPGAPRDELLANELIGALLASFCAPSQNGGASGFFILKLQLHRFEKRLLVGIKLSFETFKDGMDRRDFQFYIGWIGRRLLKLILEQEAFELVVVNADGNDDGTENVIASGETVAHFLGGALEAANGKESVRSGADQQDEEPAEGEQQEAANFFRVFARLRVGGAGRRRGVLRSWNGHLLRIEQIWAGRDFGRAGPAGN